MRNKNVQMSFEDIYNGVSESMENRKSELVSLLEEHINLDELIPHSFHTAFYSRMGRGHLYHLDSFYRHCQPDCVNVRIKFTNPSHAPIRNQAYRE